MALKTGSAVTDVCTPVDFVPVSLAHGSEAALEFTKVDPHEYSGKLLLASRRNEYITYIQQTAGICDTSRFAKAGRLLRNSLVSQEAEFPPIPFTLLLTYGVNSTKLSSHVQHEGETIFPLTGTILHGERGTITHVERNGTFAPDGGDWIFAFNEDGLTIDVNFGFSTSPPPNGGQYLSSFPATSQPSVHSFVPITWTPSPTGYHVPSILSAPISVLIVGIADGSRSDQALNVLVGPI